MKLSTQADYAVRAVYELARHEPGAVLHTGDIAAAQHRAQQLKHFGTNRSRLMNP